MPVVEPARLERLRQFGFRKVWKFDKGLQAYGPDDAPESLGAVGWEQYIRCAQWA